MIGESDPFRAFSYLYGIATRSQRPYAVVVRLVDAVATELEFSFNRIGCRAFLDEHRRLVDSTTAAEHRAREERYAKTSLKNVSRKVPFSPDSLGFPVARVTCRKEEDTVCCTFVSDGGLTVAVAFDRELWWHFGHSVSSLSTSTHPQLQPRVTAGTNR